MMATRSIATITLLVAAVGTFSSGAIAGPTCEELGQTPLDGCAEWIAAFNHQNDPTEPAGDFANAVGVSPDGSRVFATGRLRRSSPDHDVVTVAYDATNGNELWARVFGEHGYEFGSDLAVSPDGSRVYVAALAETPGGFVHMILAYDAAAGTELWQTITPDAGPLWATIAVSPDGTIVAAAQAVADDYLTVAYDAATGEEVWTSRYDAGVDLPLAIAFGVDLDPEGRERTSVYVTGRSQVAGESYDHATVALDAGTGERRWVRRYGAAGQDEARDVAVTADGKRVIVAGWVAAGADPDVATVALDSANGEVVWARTYDGPSNSIDQAYSLAVSPDGARAFVAGLSYDIRTVVPGTLRFFDSDALLLTYDVNTGMPAWVSRTNSAPGAIEAWADVAVHPTGSRVYATGSTRQMGTTAAYDAGSGARVWLVRGGAGDGQATNPWALAPSPSGDRVFVVGDRLGANWYDLVTVAYEA